MKRIKITGIFVLFVVLLFSNSLLAQEYHFDFIPNKSPDEARNLRLKIVADKGYQEWVPNWQKEITGFINQVSLHLQIQTGMKIEIVAFENWQRKTSGRQDWKTLLLELFEVFPKTEKANFDIVVGLTSDSNSHGAAVYSGCTLINCMHSYVPDGYSKEIYFWLSAFSRAKIFPSVILHEIGHLFGCKHGLEKHYVMYAYTGGYSMIFCKENIDIIKKNKWRVFSKN